MSDFRKLDALPIVEWYGHHWNVRHRDYDALRRLPWPGGPISNTLWYMILPRNELHDMCRWMIPETMAVRESW